MSRRVRIATETAVQWEHAYNVWVSGHGGELIVAYAGRGTQHGVRTVDVELAPADEAGPRDVVRLVGDLAASSSRSAAPDRRWGLRALPGPETRCVRTGRG
jgi:hypothetical protein